MKWIYGENAIKSVNIRNKVGRILHLIGQMDEFKFYFKWIHAHIGYVGNELADRLAKLGMISVLQIYNWRGLNMPYSENDWLHISLEACKKSNKRKIKKRMALKWTKCKNTFGNVSLSRHLANWGIYYTRILKDERKKFGQLKYKWLTALRSGHCALNGCKKWHRQDEEKKAENKEFCDKCKVKETIQHFIFNCGKYDAERQLYIGDLVLDWSLKDLLFPNREMCLNSLKNHFMEDYWKVFDDRMIILNRLMDYVSATKRFPVGEGVLWHKV